MERLIYRTKSDDEEYARMIAEMTAEAIFKKLPPKKEPLYRLNSEAVKAAFPDVKLPTLRIWATKGKIGALGADGSYYVRLSEIENFLLGKRK